MIKRLMAGLAVFALAGCASSSTSAGKPGRSSSRSCPPAKPASASAASTSPTETAPALWSPAAPSPSDASPSQARGLPADANTKNLAFVDACTGNIRLGIAVRVTITTLSSSTQDRHYDVAHVAIQGGPQLPYGPADFQFIANDGQTYDALTTTLPESSDEILGSGTLLDDEVQGDVIFDVPTGGGKITYTSEAGGKPLVWPTSS